MLPKVRPFVQTDVDTAAQIFEGVQDGWSKNALAFSLANESLKSFVLENDGTVVAFASFLVADDAELVFIVTDQSQKQKGFGRQLLKETLAILNLPCILEVRESNIPAIKLYEGLGFSFIGKRKNFYSNPKETALIYKLD